jgi:sensor histidine kinase regulating citrate/malate metabolism
VDLSVILGNLLDNALEATVLLPKEDERLIELSIQQDGDTLTILVANTSHPVVISKEKAQPSTKEAGRAGIGMESIRERCATLHGYSHFQWKDGMFEAMVQISLS